MRWPHAALATLLVGAGTAFAAEEVRGVAHITESRAVPLNAVFEARVEDVSRADAPARVVGRTRIENPGSPPIVFTIPIEVDPLDPRGRYSVRATLSLGGQLLMTTDRMVPVLTGGSGRHVELQLGPVARAAGSASAAAALGALPATFAGDLPCADCPALRMQLDLFADRAFFLSQSYEGRGPPLYDIGRWMLSSDGAVLLLAGGREAPLRLRVGDNTLRLLAPDGSEPPPGPKPALLRRVAFAPMEPQLALRGLLRGGSETTLLECLTQRRWTVASGDAATAMRAAAEARRGAASEILVSLEGRLTGAGGSGQPVLEVQRFIGAWPGETCGPPPGRAELTNMVWRLTALQGAPVFVKAGQREPSLTLAAADGRRVARGSAGCESFTGSYTLDGSALQLAVQPVAGACPAGPEERAYLAALAQVRSWRIVGQLLELYDAQGALLARYEARALR